jgi:CTP synthase
VEYSIYEVPVELQKEGLDDLVVEHLGLVAPFKPLNDWHDVLRRLKDPKHQVRVGVVGKYIELQDAYKSVYESLTHGGIANDCKVEMVRIDAEQLERPDGEKLLAGLDGIVVPGGFGDRGTEGKIFAARYARENGVPYFGLCLGMQIAVIEFARNVAGLTKANSTEFDPDTPDPVIDLMHEQKSLMTKGGNMRLGGFQCRLREKTRSAKAYGAEEIRERHRHRYEFNNAYMEQLEQKGLVFAGINPDRALVEIVEVKDHPWFVGVQFHPEFQSKPNKAHPLFAAFIEASLKKRNGRCR